MSEDQQVQYTIHSPLAAGGMGQAFLADSPQHPGESFVLKVLALPGQSRLELGAARLRHEAGALLKLRHPNIVSLLDAGELEAGGTPFLVLAYAPGEVLSHVIERWKTVPQSLAVAIAAQILDALTYAHSQGIIHRDLKPDNVILCADHGTIDVKVLDFGLAQLMDELSTNTAITGSGAVVGTPSYMAPEQVVGQGVDGRSDLYALGLILYEMLTGQRAHAAETPTQSLLRRIEEPAPRPSLLGFSAIPRPLEDVIVRALEPDPTARFSDPQEMARALAAAVGVDAPARPALPPSALQDLRREPHGVTAQHTELVGWDALIAQLTPPPTAPLERPRTPYLALIGGVLCAALLAVALAPTTPAPSAPSPPPLPTPSAADLTDATQLATSLLGDARLWGWELHLRDHAWSQRAWFFLSSAADNPDNEGACLISLVLLPGAPKWRGAAQDPDRCGVRAGLPPPQCAPRDVLDRLSLSPEAAVSLRYAPAPDGAPLWRVEDASGALFSLPDASCATARSIQ
jgi:serine/threonine protein kinase